MKQNRKFMEGHPTSEELYEFIDGRLPTGSGERIERHLSVCEVCRSELRLVRSLDEATRSQPLPMPSPEFLATLTTRVVGTQARRRRRFSPFVPGLMLAAVVVGWIVTLKNTGTTAVATETQDTITRHVVDYLDQAFSFLVGVDGRVIVLALGAIPLLIILDRFISRRFLGSP